MVLQTKLDVAAAPTGLGMEGVALSLLFKSKGQFWSLT